MNHVTEKRIEELGKEAEQAAQAVVGQALQDPHSLATFGLTIHQAEQVIAFLEGELAVAQEARQTDLFLNLWRTIARVKAHAAKSRRANNLQAWAFELKIRALKNGKGKL